jgi:putative transposase
MGKPRKECSRFGAEARMSSTVGSREPAKECSPRRKPWAAAKTGESPEGAEVTMPHTTTNLLVHFIFSTEQRCPLIHPDFEKDLMPTSAASSVKLEAPPFASMELKIHVRLLVRVPANHSVADIARLIKTNSSKWIHEKWPKQRLFAWQTGYGAFTVSESGVNAVRNYISDQQEHHRKGLFQDEFLAFLKENGITVDERYLWG